MQTKLKYPLFFVAALLIAYLIYNLSEKPFNKKVTIQKTTKMISKAKYRRPRQPSQEEIQREEFESNIFREITTSRYSDDLIIETSALVKEMNNCELLNAYDTTKNKNSRFTFKRIQQKTIEQALTNCQRLLKTYPILGHTSNKLLNPVLLHLSRSSNSPYAQLILSSYQYDQLSVLQKKEYQYDLARFIIQTKNAQISLYLSEVIMNIEINDPLELSNILETINAEYIGLIGIQASLLLSCEFNNSITCSPTSTYMINNCANDEKACGKNLKTWFKFNNSPAHNRDIEKVVAYFKSL
jgi:hypothetical protein